jgi:hypothetical protein
MILVDTNDVDHCHNFALFSKDDELEHLKYSFGNEKKEHCQMQL